MIEALFTESAAGAMQYAKSMKHTMEQIDRVEEERKNRLKNAVPMEGSPRDVVVFPLNLSMGDISAPLSDARAEFLQSLVVIPGAEFAGVGAELVSSARESLDKVLTVARNHEPVRIWTSRNPDELCGLCHLLTLLPKEADIRVVELPDYELCENAMTTYSAWGEVLPERLGTYGNRERKLTDLERRHFGSLWRELQQENGPLRAVVNGKLCTVSADFYDTFILRELDKQPEEFHEAHLIGNVLGRYQLGIGDALVALRLEEFIARGMLEPVTEPEKDCPVYHRHLRKT